jgi:hypothetical protein
VADRPTKSFIWEITMNIQLFGFLAAGTFAITLPVCAYAWNNDNDSCSNATLKGDYAFVVSGQVFNAGGITLRQGVARTHFDGYGHLTQEDFVIATPPNGISAPVPAASDEINSTTDFHINETGTYTVNSDCTGHAEIIFPAPPVPGATGAVINLMFVLSNHGRAIHTVVSSLIPPSTPSPLGAYLGASIHSDGWKIDFGDRDVD